MQNLRPSNVKVIFQRPSCGSPIAVASGFIAGILPLWVRVLVEFGSNGAILNGTALVVGRVTQSERERRERERERVVVGGCGE